MIAVLIASSVPSSTFYILSAVCVAALGIGPLATWIASNPLPRRFVYATALGLALSALFILGAVHGRFHASQIYSCDFSWDMELLCWLWLG